MEFFGEYGPDAFAKAMHAIEADDDEPFDLEEDPGTLADEDDAMDSQVSEQVQEHVNEAARMLLPAAATMQRPGAGTVAECLHALLWPFIVSAASMAQASPAETVPGAEDRRAKPWQYVARFWRSVGDDEDPELIGETEPAIITSTGALPKIITDLAAEMHEGAELEAFALENLKAMLPQFRNNLGRGSSAALRIPYELEGIAYRCQVDVHRLNGA